ncbi:hypothetical protein BDY19DRAFT_916882 [Irpex rosettiformis]|uniref:Uncharacterized protein n=1 Tax=Irpex rosettiformis TaxID=378272 RepID=A0ACB8ULD4_9APHY|nr:hypothetical protein BDY19DRAFT_916882 [Irpex rosettiformis]
MDRRVIWGVRRKLDYVNWDGKYPQRCLDLCCGLGDWAIDCAKLWPDTTFVGFDISKEQINLDYLDPSVAGRIEWVHGNILDKLPFGDCEFDFVHMYSIGLCIPEDKVYTLYLVGRFHCPHFLTLTSTQEIARIMKPGGIVQEMDEDAIFPVLPRWFTSPLHAMGSTTTDDPPPSPMTTAEEPLLHDHALLERLFYSTFESRFISPRPSSVFPGYFSSVFTQVRSPPVLNFYMPPLAPLPPFNRENIPPATYFTKPARRLPVPQPPPNSPNPLKLSLDSQLTPVAFPTMRRPSHPLSPLSVPLPSSSANSPIYPLPRNDSMTSTTSSLPSTRSAYHSTSILTTIETITAATSSSSGSSITSASTGGSNTSLAGLNTGSVTFAGYGSGGETTHIGEAEEAYTMVKMENLLNNDHHSLYVHLYHAVRVVHACKERMWDELKEMVWRGDESLRKYGWEKEEDWTEGGTRKKFKKLWERFEYDTHERIAMWHPLVHYGWTYPRHGAMTESEILEREEIRRTILAARALAHAERDENEPRKPMRQIRLMVGVKPKDP